MKNIKLATVLLCAIILNSTKIFTSDSTLGRTLEENTKNLNSSKKTNLYLKLAEQHTTIGNDFPEVKKCNDQVSNFFIAMAHAQESWIEKKYIREFNHQYLECAQATVNIINDSK